MYVVYGMSFNVFVGSANTINMFNLIDNYSFIPLNGCVGRGPSSLLSPGAYYDINTALLIGTDCTVV